MIKGASPWLMLLPIESEFSMTKANFGDGQHLGYGLNPENLPVKYSCTKEFSSEHALSFPKSGFKLSVVAGSKGLFLLFLFSVLSVRLTVAQFNKSTDVANLRKNGSKNLEL